MNLGVSKEVSLRTTWPWTKFLNSFPTRSPPRTTTLYSLSARSLPSTTNNNTTCLIPYIHLSNIPEHSFHFYLCSITWWLHHSAECSKLFHSVTIESFGTNIAWRQTLEDSRNLIFVDVHHEKQACEGNILLNECELILETFQNNKAPGNDGIPVEFLLEVLALNQWTFHKMCKQLFWD